MLQQEKHHRKIAYKYFKVKNMKKIAFIISLITLLISTVGCKTQEQINRERMIDDMVRQMDSGQKVTADTTTRIQALEEQLSNLTGKIENITHKNGEMTQEQITKNQEDLKLLKESNATIMDMSIKQQEKISALENELIEQKKYLEELLNVLEKITGTKTVPNKKNNDKKKNHKKDDKKKTNNKTGQVINQESPFTQAVTYFQNKQYTNARLLFQEQLENKKLKKKEKAQVLHHLGLIEYQLKNYDNALIYFSKLFTEQPKSKFAPDALLYLGKTFNIKKQTSEAKAAYKELITNYPQTQASNEASSLLKKL